MSSMHDVHHNNAWFRLLRLTVNELESSKRGTPCDAPKEAKWQVKTAYILDQPKKKPRETKVGTPTRAGAAGEKTYPRGESTV